MFGLAGRQGNARQNDTEIPRYPSQHATLRRASNNARKEVDRSEPFRSDGGNVSQPIHYGNLLEVPQKTKERPTM